MLKWFRGVWNVFWHNYRHGIMKYFFAPLEGITGYIYRQAHHAFYPGIDRYYTPFIVPKEKKYLSTKERNDVLPEHNQGVYVIPQIMTNKSAEFLRIAQRLYTEFGYTEVNLNLGCPSKTVVSKGRRSGFLFYPDQLKIFLEEVLNGLEPDHMKLSIKTRIGKNDPEEFSRLLEIFRQFPLSELIIHPRIQKDFYKNKPDLEAFDLAYQTLEGSPYELCYNGDIFQYKDFGMITKRFPKIESIMLGRGLLSNPMLVEEIKVRENGLCQNNKSKTAVLQRFLDENAEKAERKRRYKFYRQLAEQYMLVMSGEKDVLFKMKEIWMYMSQDFTNPQPYIKKMKKAQYLKDFDAAAAALCNEQRLLNV